MLAHLLTSELHVLIPLSLPHMRVEVTIEISV